MARFTPDSDLVDNYVHAVYRYKTSELDEYNKPIYRPIAFQTDLEDLTLTYSNFNILSFNPKDTAAATAAYASKVTAFDANVQRDLEANKLDLFKYMEHVANFIHVGSKLFMRKADIPTKLSQLTNDVGFVKNTETISKAETANTATKLATPITIAISGGVTGTATSFDGSGNITIPVTAVKANTDAAGNKIDTTYAKKKEIPGAMTTTDLSNKTTTVKAISAKVLSDYVAEQVSSISGGIKSITTGSTNGTLKVDGTDVAVKGLGSAAFTPSTRYAAASHEHTSDDVKSMLGYSKPTSYTAITINDTLNGAIGKLEKNFDNYQPNLSLLTASEVNTGTATTERSINAKVLSDFVISKVPKSVGSSHKFVYSNSNGVLTATDFEIWVTN